MVHRSHPNGLSPANGSERPRDVAVVVPISGPTNSATRSALRSVRPARPGRRGREELTSWRNEAHDSAVRRPRNASPRLRCEVYPGSFGSELGSKPRYTRRFALAFFGNGSNIPRRGDPRPAGLALLYRVVARISCDLGRVDERVGPPRRARGASSRFPRWPGGPPTAQHVRIGAESPWQSAISRDGDVRTMKRQFIAGVMGLALAGCAHSRSEVPKGPGTGNPVGPVGMQPVPSIHDSINRGTGNAAMAQSGARRPQRPALVRQGTGPRARPQPPRAIRGTGAVAGAAGRSDGSGSPVIRPAEWVAGPGHTVARYV